MPPYRSSKKWWYWLPRKPPWACRLGSVPGMCPFSCHWPPCPDSLQTDYYITMNYIPWTQSVLFGSPTIPCLCLLALLISALWTAFYIAFIRYLTSHFPCILLQTASAVLADSIPPASPCWAKLKICSWHTVSWQSGTCTFWWTSGGNTPSIMILAGLWEVLIIIALEANLFNWAFSRQG